MSQHISQVSCQRMDLKYVGFSLRDYSRRSRHPPEEASISDFRYLMSDVRIRTRLATPYSTGTLNPALFGLLTLDTNGDSMVSIKTIYICSLLLKEGGTHVRKKNR